jgi:hypothetical protein
MLPRITGLGQASETRSHISSIFLNRRDRKILARHHVADPVVRIAQYLALLVHFESHGSSSQVPSAWIIYECRREAFETEARRGF